MLVLASDIETHRLESGGASGERQGSMRGGGGVDRPLISGG